MPNKHTPEEKKFTLRPGLERCCVCCPVSFICLTDDVVGVYEQGILDQSGNHYLVFSDGTDLSVGIVLCKPPKIFDYNDYLVSLINSGHLLESEVKRGFGKM